MQFEDAIPDAIDGVLTCDISDESLPGGAVSRSNSSRDLSRDELGDVD